MAVHEGNVNTVFEVTMVDENGDPLELAGATLTEIRFEGDDKVGVERTATVTDAANGVMEYATLDGDLDAFGAWKYQGHVVLSGSNGEFYSQVFSFTLHKNIDVP